MNIKLPHLSFQIAPEGTYVVKITGATYDETWGNVIVDFISGKNEKIRYTYRLMNKDGSPNEVNMKMLSYLMRNATGDFDSDELDTDAMIGKYVLADISHYTSPTNGRTYVNVKNTRPTIGFEPIEVQEETPFDTSLLD